MSLQLDRARNQAGVIDAVIPPAAPSATMFARFGNSIPMLFGLLLIVGGIVLGAARTLEAHI